MQITDTVRKPHVRQTLGDVQGQEHGGTDDALAPNVTVKPVFLDAVTPLNGNGEAERVGGPKVSDGAGHWEGVRVGWVQLAEVVVTGKTGPDL